MENLHMRMQNCFYKKQLLSSFIIKLKKNEEFKRTLHY